MADFLVFNRDHWMDMPSRQRPDLTGYENVKRKISETPLSIEDKTFNLWRHQQKYDRRCIAGDIVEVRKDGAPGGRKEIDSFDKWEVPDILFEDAKQYMQLDMDGDIKMHQRKYWVDRTGIVLDQNKRVRLSGTEMLSRIKVKK